MDCDTAWIGDAALPICETVGGKIVDFARPPEAVIATIFAEAELGEPDWVPVSIPTGPGEQRTDRNNFNGGVYVLAGSFSIPKLDIALAPLGGLVLWIIANFFVARIPSMWIKSGFALALRARHFGRLPADRMELPDPRYIRASAGCHAADSAFSPPDWSAFQNQRGRRSETRPDH